METFEAIVTRRSIRQFKPEAIPDQKLELLIKAAMYAPSARNERPWHFVVLRKPETFTAIQKFHPYAKMLDQSAAAILVCADLDLEKSPGYWMVDCAAATQNLLLAAHNEGLGSVWLGVYPRVERMQGMSHLLNLSDNIKPFSLVALGYAVEMPVQPERFDASRIHFEKW